MTRISISIVGVLAMVFASTAATAKPVVIKPGPDVQKQLQEALITAEPGGVIELAEGKFEFTMGLSLDVEKVTVRGKGMDKTILSFAKQNAGSEGLLVTSNGVTLEDFSVQDTKGDAIKIKGAKGIYMRRVKSEWTGGPKATNGSYGMYPVESTDVLLDGCVSIGASDAGIYVGQSKNIILRNCRAEQNVAGIEIENCYGADVYNNVATKNAGGILVFDLPDLPQQHGHDVRVFKNKCVDNDTPNFAPKGNVVATVPTGTGFMIMANSNVEVFENTATGNQTSNLMIVSYLSTGRPIQDKNYYPYPEAIHVHNNTFGNGGQDPKGDLTVLLADAVGKPFPDILWDGTVNTEKYKDGKLPEGRGIYIHDNGPATFVNFDMKNTLANPKQAKLSRDLAVHAGKLPPLAPIKIQGVD